MANQKKYSDNKGLGRRNFLAGMAALAAGAAFGEQSITPKRRPNVVLFLVDDMGWMDSGVYGSCYYETPNIDRLAKRSMRFTNAYAAAPLCTATRASIMTGKYPGRLHVTGASGHRPASKGALMPQSGPPHQSMLLPRCQGYLPLEEYTLGEALHDAGYQTAFIGKWHLGHDEAVWPEHQGFERNVGVGAGPVRPATSPYHISKLPDGPDGEYIADRLTDEAITFLDEAKADPFFLCFWQYAVHAPYQAKEDYQAYFEGKQDPRAAQENAVMGAMIKSMDESLGRLIDRLESLDLMEETIILFASDNGGNMYDRTARDGTNLGAHSPEGRCPTNNAPLRAGKGSVYEGGIRVPTMVYWPEKVKKPAVSDEVICSIDFYPTLLDMIGIAQPTQQHFDGVSIVPALLGKPLEREAIYGHFPHHVPAVPCRPASWVRQGDWKLIRFYETDAAFPNRLELYNLKNDIAELHNLAEEYPDKAAMLERMLDAHLKESGAFVPKKNPNFQANALREIDGWTASRDCWLRKEKACLHLESTGGDPYMTNNTVPDPQGALQCRFRMRSTSKGGGQFFWTTRKEPRFGPKQRLDFQGRHDGAWHEYRIDFEAATSLRAVRIDPSSGKGSVDFAWIELLQEGKIVKEWRFEKD